MDFKMTKDEAIWLALDALDNLMYWDNGKPEYDEARQAITALREALTSVPDWASEAIEHPAQTDWEAVAADQAMTIALLRAEQPAQRKPWVGLTDEEIISMSRYDLEYAALIGEVQRKLKEKNSD